MMKPIVKQPVKTQKSLYLKIGFILLLILLLMIPNTLIQNLILERQSLDRRVRQEIAADWGPSQRIAGPILSIPYSVEVAFEDKVKTVEHVLRWTPESMDIEVALGTEERKKGIYKSILYNADHVVTGNFNLPDTADFGHKPKEIHWEKATIDIGFTAASSLENIVHLNWNKDRYKMESGLSSSALYNTGIHAMVNLSPQQEKYTFSTIFGIHGSESIRYLPIAGNTTVKMSSSWNSPGFNGLPAPQSREITADGFSAEWNATEYNRPFKKMWIDHEINLARYHNFFGVDLVQTVGHYQKNMRSAKYALLILSLSFLIFFFFEILKGSKIHPMQYIFIGLALSVFYILLLSFSEHIGFNLAYITASVVTVLLISWYSLHILKTISKTIVMSGILTLLYAYIFTLLQMEELALLVGSLGLFFALAITMYLSRNMDWYTLVSGSSIPNSANSPMTN